MAQISVDSSVLRDKAKILEQLADAILKLFEEMLKEVNTTAGKMKGTTIETEQKQFASMQPTFETFATDMKAYASFLNEAAESYESTEQSGTTRAEEQGKIF